MSAGYLFLLFPEDMCKGKAGEGWGEGYVINPGLVLRSWKNMLIPQNDFERTITDIYK